MDRQTDRQTDRHMMTATTASHGKNHTFTAAESNDSEQQLPKFILKLFRINLMTGYGIGTIGNCLGPMMSRA